MGRIILDPDICSTTAHYEFLVARRSSVSFLLDTLMNCKSRSGIGINPSIGINPITMKRHLDWSTVQELNETDERYWNYHPPAIHTTNEWETITPGFYCPAWREDGNPMEDEAKLQFFTSPLPGYEAGRRVPVNVVIAGAHEFKSTLLPPPFPELRTTTSDVPLRKPKWDSPEKCGEMASDRAMHVPLPARELSGRLALGNPYSPVKIPRSTTACNFGVIGDGRLQASSQQQNRHLVQIQATPDRQSLSQKSAFLDSLVHPNLPVWPNSKATDTYGDGESCISQCEDLGIVLASVPEVIPPVRRSRSFSNSNPSASSDSDSAFIRRVSRPVDSLTSLFANPHREENSQELVAQPKPPPATILNPSVPPIWKRGGPPFMAIRKNPNQEVTVKKSRDGLVGSRFDPESLTLPFGSTVFVMKPRHVDDVRASIKNGIWCSSANGNKILEQAWNLRKPGEMILLLFSVTGSSQYCGLAEVTGPYNHDAEPDIFLERHCRGIIPLRWIVVKDVPFPRFEAISLRAGKINQLRNAESPPGDAGRVMVQIYFEAPHSDTHILGQGNTSDTQKHTLTELRPFLTNAQDGNNAAWHQQSFYSNSSPQTPANSGSISHVLAHVPCARIPSGPASHPHGVNNFAETSNYPRSPSFYHPGLQRDSRHIPTPQFERSGASAGYQSFSESRRPDTVIHIYNNPPTLLHTDADIERRSHALFRR